MFKGSDLQIVAPSQIWATEKSIVFVSTEEQKPAGHQPIVETESSFFATLYREKS